MTLDLTDLRADLRTFTDDPPGLELHCRISFGRATSPTQALQAVLLERASVLGNADFPGGLDGTVLKEILKPLDESAVTSTVTQLLSRGLAYEVSLEPARVSLAMSVAERLVSILGRTQTWWTNTTVLDGVGSALTWGPVTERTFDACLIGAGDNITVVLLAADED